MHDDDARGSLAPHVPGGELGDDGDCGRSADRRGGGDARPLDTFRALSHPARLKLLHELVGGERTVSQLAIATGLRQPAASLHLARLKAGGLVRRRNESRQVYYALSGDPTMRLLVRIACGRSAIAVARRTPSKPNPGTG